MSRDLMPISPPSCPDGEQLKAWVDRELGAAEERAVGTHVEACPACREETRIMRELGNAMKELEGLVEPPAQLRRRILDGVGGRERSRASWWVRNPFVLVRWASAAGAVAVAVICGVNSIPSETGVSEAGKGDSNNRANPTVLMQGPARSAPLAQPQGDWRAREIASAGGGARAANVPGAPQSYYMDGYGKEAKAARDVRAIDGDIGAVNDSRLATLVPGRTNGDVNAAKTPTSPDDINVYVRGAAVDDVKRKVARTAVLSVRTRSALEGIQKEIQKRLKRDEGFVEESTLSTLAAGERTAIMRLRVPVDKLDEYVTWLASLGEVRAKEVRGSDITGTWIDQRAEVRELRKEEARLLKVYETDPKRERRNEARWQLLRVRPRIAASEERFALTTKLAALSTVELTLVEPEQARIQGNLWQDMDGTARSAVSAFMVALRIPASLLIWLVVFCPLWLPCVLLYRWASRKAIGWQAR